jgi:hypothetical protein
MACQQSASDNKIQKTPFTLDLFIFLLFRHSTTHRPAEMEKSISSSQSKSRQCWECRRRRLVCDFSLPGCHKCYTAGVECPGYGQKKPLKWVTVCEVTSRPRKKIVQQTTTKQQVSEDRSDSQVETWSLSVPRDRLVTESESIVEAAYYCKSNRRFDEQYSNE